jgi:hypothetical protein
MDQGQIEPGWIDMLTSSPDFALVLLLPLLFLACQLLKILSKAWSRFAETRNLRIP